ncbi:MAG: histidine phosphatase family protein [Synergistaceae bacterium]|nr:histidine phosphatase family protein [Synergistaceae bacterium]
MRIYLIRHAQSLANAENVWTGQRDIPLSPQGVAEQREICARFSYPRAEFYFSSPLKRCTQSLELIYGRAADYLPAALSECSLGILEGRPYTNLDDDPNYTAWLAAPDRPIERGESFNGFTERVCAGFAALLSRCRAAGVSTAAGMMHGNVMRAVLHRFADKNIPHGEWRIPNGGMYILEFNAEGELISWSTAPGFLFV